MSKKLNNIYNLFIVFLNIDINIDIIFDIHIDIHYLGPIYY
jgi:hypothetical protein